MIQYKFIFLSKLLFPSSDQGLDHHNLIISCFTKDTEKINIVLVAYVTVHFKVNKMLAKYIGILYDMNN